MPQRVRIHSVTEHNVRRDGGRGHKPLSKTTALIAIALSKTRTEGTVRTNCRLHCHTDWSDGATEDWDPAWSTNPRGNRDRDDPHIHVFGQYFYVHRLVAFAFGNTPGVSFDEFCNARGDDGQLQWVADHTNEDPSTIYSYGLEVVSAAENRRRQQHRA